MPNLNPEILKWARETSGFNLDEASKILKINPLRGISGADRLKSLEEGSEEPSRPVLLRMAKQYRRPLITFYLEKPPSKGNRGEDFRTLPDTYGPATHGLVDALIRNVLTRQAIIRSSIADDVDLLEYVGSMKPNVSVQTLSDFIYSEFDISLQEFQSKDDPDDGFRYLREKVELQGVFVVLIGDLGSYHTAFDLDAFRGFSLADDKAPFIVINDRDAHAAWSFTLIHELCHILLGQTGISNSNSERAIERYCDRVAGQVLLPKEEIQDLVLPPATEYEELREMISRFAFSKNVSSTMVAFKLLESSRIDFNIWSKLSKDYKAFWLKSREQKKEKNKQKKGGPDPYVVKRHRMGKNLLSLINEKVLTGEMTSTDASKVLGIKSWNLGKLLLPNQRNVQTGK